MYKWRGAQRRLKQFGHKSYINRSNSLKASKVATEYLLPFKPCIIQISYTKNIIYKASHTNRLANCCCPAVHSSAHRLISVDSNHHSTILFASNLRVLKILLKILLGGRESCGRETWIFAPLFSCGQIESIKFIWFLSIPKRSIALSRTLSLISVNLLKQFKCRTSLFESKKFRFKSSEMQNFQSVRIVLRCVWKCLLCF